MADENNRAGAQGSSEAYHSRYPFGKVDMHAGGTVSAMHAEKIRTADLPAFRLDPKDATIMLCLIGIGAYILGFLIGLAV